MLNFLWDISVVLVEGLGSDGSAESILLLSTRRKWD